ncbi:carbohydrate ABC transporter permease [Natronospora cellulosivora (SeqCode)]
MDLRTKIKIKQNLIAYAFLAAPLALLGLFSFYPLAHGIYISFMRYEILRRPNAGGPLAFISHFIRNLQYLNNPLFNILILLFSIAALVYVLKKKIISNKLMLTGFLLALVIINILPAANVFQETLVEINYVVHEDRILNNQQAEGFIPVLENRYTSGRFKDSDVLITTEKVGEDQTRILVQESIWIGIDHYRRIVRNPEFAEFLRRNNWYKVLLSLSLLGIMAIIIYSKKKAKEKKIDLSLKIGTGILFVILLVVTWPRMFHDRMWLFYRGMENSLKYLLVVPPIQICSILLAVLVNQKIKGIKLFRTLYYIPVITGIIIIGYSWKWVFNPNGLLNSMLQMINILEQGQRIYWLSNPSIAIWVVMFVTFWRGLGYYMVIYMAGLQNIPEDLIEAATIDGASKMQLLSKIYLPLLRPTIMICTILSTMAALKIFEEIFVLTSGAADTTTMVYLIYNTAFGGSSTGTQFRFGYSSALAVILSIVIGIFTIINFKVNRSDTYV